MGGRLERIASDVDGVEIVVRRRLEDERGFFERLFCAEELASSWKMPIVQVNQTETLRQGTVRGMHFQYPPHAEKKLVICLQGEVFDVALDLRAGSNTFLRWHGEHLSAANGRALLIPQGIAHGFQTLTPNVRMLYFHSAAYTSGSEGGIHPGDPRIAVTWPLPIAEMSARDRSFPLLNTDFSGVCL